MDRFAHLNVQEWLDYRAIRKVLLRRWDPIGVREELNAQDEYDSYLENIYNLLVDGATERQIAEHLDWIETQWMGVREDCARTRRIARELLALELRR